MPRKPRLITKQDRAAKKLVRSAPLIRQRAVAQLRDAPLKDDLLQEIVRRIVLEVQAEKIILFGSAARGEMGPDSDLDLLVITACDHRRNTARKIRRALFGIRVPIDIIVAKPEDIERYGDSIGLIYRPALREGKVLYAA